MNKEDGSRSSSGIIVAPMSHARADGDVWGLIARWAGRDGRCRPNDSERGTVLGGALRAGGVVGCAGGMEECRRMDFGDGWIR